LLFDAKGVLCRLTRKDSLAIELPRSIHND
jgi:hypothetical protein